MTLLPGQLGKPATELSALLDYMWPKKVLLTPPPPCQTCPQVHRLACQQTTIQEWHTKVSRQRATLEISCWMPFLSQPA